MPKHFIFDKLLCDSPAHIEAWFQLTLLSLHKQSYVAGAYDISYALHCTVCIISPSLQTEDYEVCKRKMRERERNRKECHCLQRCGGSEKSGRGRRKRRLRQHPRPLGSCTRYARRAPILTMVPHWSQLSVCGSWIRTSEWRVSGGKGLPDRSGLTVEWRRWVAMWRTCSWLLCPASGWTATRSSTGAGEQASTSAVCGDTVSWDCDGSGLCRDSQTSAKWCSRLHAVHFVPQAGHSLRVWWGRPPQNQQTVFVAGGVEAGWRRGLGVIRGAERAAEVKADLRTDRVFTASAGLSVNSASVFVADSSLRQRATTSSNLGKGLIARSFLRRSSDATPAMMRVVRRSFIHVPHRSASAANSLSPT